jgi:hypothetical protein
VAEQSARTIAVWMATPSSFAASWWVRRDCATASATAESSGSRSVKSATGVLRMSDPLPADLPPFTACACAAAPSSVARASA